MPRAITFLNAVNQRHGSIRRSLSEAGAAGTRLASDIGSLKEPSSRSSGSSYSFSVKIF